MAERALVKNAGDAKQVADAGDKERIAEARRLDDVKNILSNPAGRRFLLWLLHQCGVFRSIWRPSAEIHYLSGQQDIGLLVLEEIKSADRDAALKMLLEGQSGKEERDE